MNNPHDHMSNVHPLISIRPRMLIPHGSINADDWADETGSVTCILLGNIIPLHVCLPPTCLSSILAIFWMIQQCSVEKFSKYEILVIVFQTPPPPHGNCVFLCLYQRQFFSSLPDAIQSNTTFPFLILLPKGSCHNALQWITHTNQTISESLYDAYG